jgi:hypothetical protein
LYREPGQEWAAYLHDDWLETRITFGWVGFGMILAIMAAILARWWVGAGIPVPWDFVSLIILAFSGALLHAKFDLPFQIHSIVLLFLFFCAILFSSCRRP